MGQLWEPILCWDWTLSVSIFNWDTSFKNGNSWPKLWGCTWRLRIEDRDRKLCIMYVTIYVFNFLNLMHFIFPNHEFLRRKKTTLHNCPINMEISNWSSTTNQPRGHDDEVLLTHRCLHYQMRLVRLLVNKQGVWKHLDVANKIANVTTACLQFSLRITWICIGIIFFPFNFHTNLKCLLGWLSHFL